MRQKEDAHDLGFARQYLAAPGVLSPDGRERRRTPAEIPHLARIWYDGWRDSHAAILPAALAQVRTLDSFAERLAAALPTVRVTGPPGAPTGLCMTRDDELYQLYVSAAARGTGVAAALIADAESRLAAAGVRLAWLACAIGNGRAARFYEKSGWHRAGTVVSRRETAAGIFELDVWRYKKALRRPPPPSRRHCPRRAGRCPHSPPLVRSPPSAAPPATNTLRPSPYALRPVPYPSRTHT